jgi:energy-coupling factor transporter ATP-binding protein EcfA2
LNEEILFDLRTEAFKIKFPSTDEYIEFDFQAVSDVLDSDTIPNGIVALIGKNGSGKSTTLYEIAKILYASPDTRRLIEDKVGRLETNAIGISKLIMFSYSAFDNFILPGSTKYECTMLIDGLQNHTGRFVFCGIRDVYYDMNELYETNRNKEDDEFIKITSCARTTGIRLKEPAKLGEEFVSKNRLFGIC